jgi:hypothetical protein
MFKILLAAITLLMVPQVQAQYSSTGSGYAASTIAVGVGSSYHALLSNETSITGLFTVGSLGAIQAHLLVAGTDPAIFGVAGNYKHTISGDLNDGFHVGGGVGFGSYTQNQNFFALNGIAGFHFGVAKRVLVHVDAGLTLANSNSRSQLKIGGHSSLFGISLLYAL